MRNIIRSNVRWALSGLCFVLALLPAYGQQQKSITLLDKESGDPIAGASFSLGSQTGLSNEHGAIQFEWTTGARESMALSHVTYGQWRIGSKALETARKGQRFYRQEKIIGLKPVSVISLREKDGDTHDIGNREKSAHDAGALLTHDPAVAVIRKGGGYGFDPVLRGFKYDQLNVVMDGCQSATAACPNRMDPPTSQMAPNMLGKIEVAKGPYSLRYGAGLGGTINFVSQPPSYHKQSGSFGRYSTLFESNGTVWRNEAMAGTRGDRFDARLFASYSQGRDYSAGNGEEIASGFERLSVGMTVNYLLAQNHDLGFNLTNNRANDTDFAGLPMDLISDDTWMFRVNHTATFHGGALKKWRNVVFGSFVDHAMDNSMKNLNPRMVDAETLAKTQNYGARTEGTWSFGQSKLFAGADYRYESADGNRERHMLKGPMAGKVLVDKAWQDSYIQKTGVFAEYHQELSGYQLVLSARVDVDKAGARDISEGFDSLNPETPDTQANPSFSVGAMRALATNWNLSLWLGHARRSGNLTERFINFFPVGNDPYEILGNPDLSPEANSQADLVLEWKSDKVQWRMVGFVAYTKDFITSIIDKELKPVMPKSPGVRRMVNLDKALRMGGEMEWRQMLARHWQHSLSVAYTYGEDLDRKDPLPEIAPLDVRYVVGGALFGGKLLPEFSLRHVLKQNRVSEEFGERKSEAFTLADINLTYRPLPWLDLDLGLKNLFDTTYFEHLSRANRNNDSGPIYSPGRSFVFALRARFGEE
ncbi:ligand-gated channel [Fulvitalea axinellae]|uniref:Ligand-gated channel n=1 Tax=Fulvitalea axinellae TaxID=1182444 RepID=A0AAU9CLJ5_9BACT|nr:ligand-gated channel [Fulvitalea axinellae]